MSPCEKLQIFGQHTAQCDPYVCLQNMSPYEKLQIFGQHTAQCDPYVCLQNMSPCEKLQHIYSQICIKRSPLGQSKSGLLRQVTSEKRLNLYELFYVRTRIG